MAKKNVALAKREEQTTLAAPLEPWEQQLAEQAKADVANESQGIPRISHKGGKITINGKMVSENKLPHIVGDFILSKAYYEGAYDPNVPQTPVCYAFGRDEKSMTPHEAAPSKQSERCLGCPHNAFGTAEKGKGKRCKDERRVLAFVPTEGPGGEAQGEARTYNIPPGSLKSWGQYLAKIPDIEPRYKNVRAVVTELGTQDESAGYSLTFKAVERVAPEQVRAIQQRASEMEAQLFAPYPVIEAEEKPAAKRSAKQNRKLD